jgi:plasmid maintenance system antidote protein VapI
MHARGLTDPGLARKLGISKQQIFNLRRGHRKLTVEWAKRIAPHLDVSWQELITGPPSPPADQTLAELRAAIEAMDEEQRQVLLMMAKVMARRDKPPEATPDPPPKPKPHRTAACIVRQMGRRLP